MNLIKEVIFIELKEFKLKNGGKLSYAEYGNSKGKVVFVLGGLLSSIKSNESLDTLPYRVICLARPGYGLSDYFEMNSVLDWAILLEDFIAYLKVESFNIVGISAGAPYAYALAKHYQTQTEGVYISKGLAAVYRDDILALYDESNVEFYEEVKNSSREDIGKKVYDAYMPFFSEEIKNSDDFKDAMSGELLNIGQEVKLQVLPWGFELSEINCPTVLIHGTEDTEVPYVAVKKTTTLIPNARLITLEGIGHFEPQTLEALVNALTENIKGNIK